MGERREQELEAILAVCLLGMCREEGEVEKEEEGFGQLPQCDVGKVAGDVIRKILISPSSLPQDGWERGCHFSPDSCSLLLQVPHLFLISFSPLSHLCITLTGSRLLAPPASSSPSLSVTPR